MAALLVCDSAAYLEVIGDVSGEFSVAIWYPAHDGTGVLRLAWLASIRKPDTMRPFVDVGAALRSASRVMRLADPAIPRCGVRVNLHPDW